jgi:hypothetical protein
VVAEFDGDPDRLADEIIRLRATMGRIGEMSGLTLEGREVVLMPVGPSRR